MTLQSITYVGVDLSTGRRPFTFAALDEEQRILAFGEGEMSDALAYIAGLYRGVVAVCAPQQLNSGRMTDPTFRQSLDPQPEKGRWNDLRVVEYELGIAGLSVPRTPARMNYCPYWIRGGFAFYERLENELGYFPYPAELEDGSSQRLEVQPDACYWSLLNVVPFPALSLEGRIQRQLALAELGLKVPDAMDFFEEVTRYRLLRSILPLEDIHSTAELNALIAAYTAWVAGNQPERLQAMGIAEEGLVYLPCPEKKRSERE